MKSHSIIAAVVMFMLGGLTGHVLTLPSAAKTEAAVAQISTFDLTMKAGHLPVQTANAI